MKREKTKDIEQIVVKSTSREVIDEIAQKVMVTDCCVGGKEVDRTEFLSNTLTFECPSGRLSSIFESIQILAHRRGTLSKITERPKLETEYSDNREIFVEKEVGKYFEILII